MALLPDFIKVLDFTLGRAVCALLAPLGSARPPADASQSAPRRVLVIRPGGIGDAVLFLPMLSALRSAWPAASIELLAERRNASVVESTGLVDRVLRYDRWPGDLFHVLRGRYDLVIDTEQFHCLSAIIAWLTRAPRRIGFGTTLRRRLLTDPLPYDLERYEAELFLELARVATGRPVVWDRNAPFYPLTAPAIEQARQRLGPLLGRPVVAIHPGASIPERRWPQDRYARLARQLADSGCGVLILGGPTDTAAARMIVAALGSAPHLDVAGRCTLPDAAALVAQCDVYVSADSGVLHLAYAVGTPTVHLFGPGVLSKWGPPGERFRSIAAQVPCSPCTTYGYTPPCCQGMVCMLQIEPEDVSAVVLQQLADGHRRPIASVAEGS